MDYVFSVTLHCEGLASTSRSVDKNGAVLTVEEGIAQVKSIAVVKNFLLRRYRVEHLLKREQLLLLLCGTEALADDDLCLVAIDDGVIDYLNADGVPQLVWDLGAHASNHIYRNAIFLISSRCILNLIIAAQVEF